MARYRNSQDLGVFIGARFISQVFEEGGRPVRGLFIPTDINGIDVQKDEREAARRNVSGLRAFINTQQRQPHQRYIDAIRQSVIRRGDEVTAYNVPAYQICYILPEEKRLRIRKALRARVLAQHPEWSQQSDTPGTDLSREISRMVPFQMGDSYLIPPANASQQERASSGMQAEGLASRPMAQPAAFDTSDTVTDDDLPF